MIDLNNKKHHSAVNRLANLFIRLEELYRQTDALLKHSEITVNNMRIVTKSMRAEIDDLLKIIKEARNGNKKVVAK